MIAAIDARDLALTAIQCAVSARALFKSSIGDRCGLREDGCLALFRSATALAIETSESALIACSKVPARIARVNEIARYLGQPKSPLHDPSVRSDGAPLSS